MSRPPNSKYFRHILFLIVGGLLLLELSGVEIPGFGGASTKQTSSSPAPHASDSSAPSSQTRYDDDADKIQSAFDNRQSDIIVSGSATVVKVLADDRDGSQHQRFLMRLDNGLTLLVAHNIDLAPRIDKLQAGDTIGFKGEYEWNQKGGVLHWTHHDPRGRHAGGWLDHKGKRHQ
ncbi:MAG: DUF3465 domain-containing protein [Porticoccaceae bacterium]